MSIITTLKRNGQVIVPRTTGAAVYVQNWTKKGASVQANETLDDVLADLLARIQSGSDTLKYAKGAIVNGAFVAEADVVEGTPVSPLIYLQNGDAKVSGYIDATDFLKDGMIESVVSTTVKQTVEGEEKDVQVLRITWNTDSGKSDITDIPLDKLVPVEVVNRVGDLEDRADAVEGRVDAVEGRVDAVEGRVDTAEADIDAIEKVLNGDAEAAEQADKDGLKKRVADLESTVTEIIDEHEQTTAAALCDLDERVLANVASIEALEGRVGANETAIAGINTRLDGLDTTIAQGLIADDEVSVDALFA